ncbi:MAG TPA: right-handed parallel beta-helix repeat-containing protein, partial [Candidatus Glassbacteria bacterium]|nr:right-handed parallel beta-helix repeat-containing protein [Candidatus Glassbacteria bacterium]
MKSVSFSAVFLSCSIFLNAISGLNAQQQNPRAVPTFECLGIYYDVEANDPGECSLRYRSVGTESWIPVIAPVFDKRDHQFRGSLVGLEPGAEYEIELTCQGKPVAFKAATRSESIPVGKVDYLSGGVSDTLLEITESGTANAWHLFTPRPGEKTVIDPEKTVDNNIVISASYVIIRGLELANAAQDAIYIKKGSHDIVIEDCHITGWGRGGQRYVYRGYGDSGVRAEEAVGGLVIQRNLFDNPSGASNDWDTGHPSGPQAITLWNSSGNNVIRYNEIVSSEDHGFNDAVGGGSNFSWEGSPNRDSDIYGNIIANVWDDAIETEGANMNVRIWANYLHHTYTPIATATTSKGPLYIFRNVFGLSRHTHANPLGGPMIKVGGDNREFRGGRRYVFHNTALQPNGSFSVFSSHQLSDVITRNNIFD